MSDRDPRLDGETGRAFNWVLNGLGDVRDSGGWIASIEAWVRRAKDEAHRLPIFPPVALAVACAAHDIAPIASCSTALHLATGLQGDGHEAEFGGAASDVLVFLAQSFLAEIEDDQKVHRIVRCLGYAGIRMAKGRARHAAAPLPSTAEEADSLVLSAMQKTGTAYAYYAQSAAVAGGVPSRHWEALWRWGKSVGGARQLLADAAAIPGTEAESFLLSKAEQLLAEARGHLAEIWLPWGGRALFEAVADKENMAIPETIAATRASN
ncbi:MAG: hypothetical protein FJZ00_01175 [Candidatus Sericytochromatia bacterium]|uniref:Uncharacterized protein n=1 Tax=Candidatus Tanganyikabacteria bacterium TaxID=2961651 RepID=A0A937X3Y5_9BACT|nr:hypothetical protein [Candidatus Tanganyikabacteria bacterium]